MFKLNLKIKSFSLKHEGKVNRSKEVLKSSKALEDQHVEKEVTKNKVQIVDHLLKDGLFNPPVDKESDVAVSKEDMHDQTLNSIVTNLGWKNDEFELVTIKAKLVKEAIGKSKLIVDSVAPDLS